jgi:hypothetical protein
MRQSNRPNTKKEVAKLQYALRQVDKWCKWSWKQRNKIIYKELVEIQDYYKIKVV